ncbi:MAG: zinc-binding dehydrogenase, partial [Methylobacterium sp.]
GPPRRRESKGGGHGPGTGVRAIDANGMRPVIDSRYPLDALVEAFKHQESNRHFGKICLEM